MARKPPAPTFRSEMGAAERFAALYRSNQRSMGMFDPVTTKVRVERRAHTITDFELHLAGEIGTGAVPIMDDDCCFWGAIDVDNHGESEDVPLAPIDEIIRAQNLPLLPCRSKRGGVHIYAFFVKAVPASRVQRMLGAWIARLGIRAGTNHVTKIELFPKQTVIRSQASGGKQLGNWINLPYIGGDDTQRYAFRNGNRLSLAEFLDLAEKLRITTEDVATAVANEHPGAPPCIQRLMADGTTIGNRNEALFNITIYMRRAFPTEFVDKAREANASVFDKSLPRSEALRTIASAGRPDYMYRCNEDPMRSLCDRPTCLTRKFGISSEDADRLATTEAIPPFSDMVMYVSEPVRWEMAIDGVRVTNIATRDLLEWRRMREIIAERLVRLVPTIKDQEWSRILGPLMQGARKIDTPDDAGVSGLIRDRLREFAAKTNLMSHGKNPDDRLALLRGLPCVQIVNANGLDERCVIFRGQDFINYLKRTRSEELKGANLWMAVKDLGVQHTKMRVGDQTVNVWTIPVKMVLGQNMVPIKFKSEI